MDFDVSEGKIFLIHFLFLNISFKESYVFYHNEHQRYRRGEQKYWDFITCEKIYENFVNDVFSYILLLHVFVLFHEREKTDY